MSRASELLCEFTREVVAETPEEREVLYQMIDLSEQLRSMIAHRKENAYHVR